MIDFQQQAKINEVEGILVTFVTCNYRDKFQKLQLGSSFKPTKN